MSNLSVNIALILHGTFYCSDIFLKRFVAEFGALAPEVVKVTFFELKFAQDFPGLYSGKTLKLDIVNEAFLTFIDGIHDSGESLGHGLQFVRNAYVRETFLSVEVTNLVLIKEELCVIHWISSLNLYFFSKLLFVED